jgi:hypothetical protein
MVKTNKVLITMQIRCPNQVRVKNLPPRNISLAVTVIKGQQLIPSRAARSKKDLMVQILRDTFGVVPEQFNVS